MTRRLFILLVVWCAAFVFVSPALAQYENDAEFGPVLLRARVRDRRGLPVPGLRLRFTVRMDGQARQPGGGTFPCVDRRVLDAVTNFDGIAQVRAAAPPAVNDKNWFRGAVQADIVPAPNAIEVSPLVNGPLQTMQNVPDVRQNTLPDVPTLFVFELPTRKVNGFPFWQARDGSINKILVLIEGFDLNNDRTATDAIRLVAPVADALRQHGVGILVVNYPDSHVLLDDLVPEVAMAIQSAARFSGGKVAVAGLSTGGLVSRYALCVAEKAGHPLPVNTLLLLDTPNRGALINPGLQALTLRYGTDTDRANLENDAAHALLASLPEAVQWKRVGILPPILGRYVPKSWTEDTHFHDAFIARLKASGGKNGYPEKCRVVGIANSSRRISPPLDGDLLHLWLPFAHWTLPARLVDHAPGSLMPPSYVTRYAQIYPFGLAGAYLRSAPTFVPCASALDANADETPPFAAWYARADNLPPLPHDVVDAGAAAFAAREILGADWQ